MKDKKYIIMFSLGVIFTLISVFNMTYAFFNERKTLEISFTSKNTFGTSVVENKSETLTTSAVPASGKNSNDKVTLSLSANDASASYMTSLIGQVDPNYTDFEDASASAIKYEIFHKTNETLDTSGYTCTDNSYTLGDSTTDYCITGDFTDKFDGAPFEMVSGYSIDANNTHYFDVYLWVSGDETGNEVEGKKIKVSFFFVTTANISEQNLDETSNEGNVISETIE